MTEAAARKGQLSDGASANVVTSAEFRPARPGSSTLAEIKSNPIRLQGLFHPHSDGRYHVNDLLKYHDRTFIQNAYRAILKRGPDVTGYKAFLESLRSARLNKIDILARLRYSAEGRAKQVEIEGLQLPAMIRKAYRVPLVGYLLNLAVALARLPLSIRSEQQFEAHVLAQQEMIVEHLNHLDNTLRAHAEEVSRVLDVQIQQQVDQTRQIEETGRQQSALNEFVKLRGDELKTRLADETAQRERAVLGLGSQIEEASSRWQESFAGFEARLRQWHAELRVAATQLHQADLSQREQIDLTAKNLKREIEHVFQKQQQVSTELVLQGERLANFLSEAHKRLSGSFDEAQLLAFAKEEDHTLDAFYASFDEQFRGSREEIKQRLRIYLAIIKQRGIGSAAMPVLDVGCGRGEWLELLSDEQLQGSGVDSNRILVEWCRNRGLEVAEEDLLSYLHGLADSSLGAVSGFHIIEHLPIETLVEFLNQTVRVLKPGGAVIFETPNPQNVLVGSCNFYFDPTHRNPLPSQVTKFLVESRGFVGVEVLNLNPSDDTPVEENSELARRFNKYFYGPMDYAVVGYRP